MDVIWSHTSYLGIVQQPVRAPGYQSAIWNPNGTPGLYGAQLTVTNLLKRLVGARGFEPPTPSPPDWCANQTALRSDHRSLCLSSTPTSTV